MRDYTKNNEQVVGFYSFGCDQVLSSIETNVRDDLWKLGELAGYLALVIRGYE